MVYMLFTDPDLSRNLNKPALFIQQQSQAIVYTPPKICFQKLWSTTGFFDF